MSETVKRKLTREEMKTIVTGGISLSAAGEYKRINKLISSGKMFRILNGEYAVSNQNEFSYILESEVANKIFSDLEKKYDRTCKYVIYESNILNFFLSHLIAKRTVIVETEKDIVDSVFWYLKDKGYKNVLLSPKESDLYLYDPLDGTGIVVKTMVSKAPIDKKNHKITLEKLVVDMASDKLLNSFYSGSENQNMIKDILENYKVKLDTVRNYAKRRHCVKTIADCAPEDLKGYFAR